MHAWPYLVLIALLVIALLVSLRNRRRQLADEVARAQRIGIGTEVMTTSGLYGTVVGKDDDGTVLLAIAPGVEVRWAAAALRDAGSLSGPYQRGLAGAPRPGGASADRAGESVQLHKNGGRDGPGTSPS